MFHCFPVGDRLRLKPHRRALLPFVETTIQDLRYGLRALRRSPGFTLTALLTLALTMGAVSTVLSLANAFVLRPIAASRPEELVVVAAVGRNAPSSQRVSYADYAHVRDHTRTLRDLAAHGSGGLFFLTYGGTTKKRSAAIVSAGFFSLLGVKPVLGRFFSADEDRVPGRDSVAVLSHRLWREGWGATPAALGAVVGDPAAALPMLVRAVNRIDPQVPVTETMPLTTALAAGDELKAIGLIIREEMIVVLAGVTGGLTLAGGASRLVRHFLYGATSGDGVLYAGAAVVVTAAALGACWVLARRAARLDPVAALRAE
ncbi:MAG: hypothetical protein DMF81_11715 [Acidobacteria bacterium]|nr:MAG: hypothetical protein DMF81_11715 [Acidobacteriota bacterium]